MNWSDIFKCLCTKNWYTLHVYIHSIDIGLSIKDAKSKTCVEVGFNVAKVMFVARDFGLARDLRPEQNNLWYFGTVKFSKQFLFRNKMSF